jgi:hypothetical protein
MPTPEKQILRILNESLTPLHSADIAAHMNRELRLACVYRPVDVVKRMQGMKDQVIHLSDGRWALKPLRKT